MSSPAPAGQRVVALPAHHGVRAAGAGQRLACRRTGLGHAAKEVPAEDHVAVAGGGLRIAQGIAKARTDDQVVEPVSIHVSRGGDRGAGLVARVLPINHEPARPGGHGDKIDGRAEPAGLAEHHVAVARIGFRIARRITISRADDQVVEPVAVHVPSASHCPAGLVAGILTMDHEPARAGRNGAKIDRGAEATRLAEHHETVAGAALRVARSVGKLCPDDQVAKPVAVHIPCRSHRPA